MCKNIVIATNLNVWSISKGVGAASFYKTLEVYNNNGFNVQLYTTEKNLEIPELENVKVIELPKLKEIKSRYFYALSRNLNFISYQLIFLFFYLFKQKKQVDVFYAYEVEFVPVLGFLSKINKKVLISRFQGTILAPLLTKPLWKLKYFPHYFSIKIKSSLTIMTDDGTKGKDVIKSIRGDDDDVLFIKNGVDISKGKKSNVSSNTKMLIEDCKLYEHNFISVSRLQSWKRLDRSINVFQEVLRFFPNSRYIIVGDGEKKLELQKIVTDKNLDGKVIFTGGLNKSDINELMFNSDIFLSHYELSNVGNPLWEALNNDCVVVTISNGDTGKVIEDGISGIISTEHDYMDNVVKLKKVLSTPSNINYLTINGKNVLKKSVTSWDDRMKAELELVTNLIKK